jgi:hypothetical protein
MVSRFQPSRLLTPFLIFLIVIAASYWLNPAPWHQLSNVSKLLFGGSSLVVVGLIATLRNRMYLRIDERGIEIKYAVGAARFYAWSDIESARIFRIRFFMIPMASSIHLKLRPGARSGNAARKVAGAITGSHASFPALFEESAQEIVEKINSFKRQAVQ